MCGSCRVSIGSLRIVLREMAASPMMAQVRSALFAFGGRDASRRPRISSVNQSATPIRAAVDPNDVGSGNEAGQVQTLTAVPERSLDTS